MVKGLPKVTDYLVTFVNATPYDMPNESLPEVWLRGPIQGLSPFLQPVAHALLQAREEVTRLMDGFPDDLLWERPWGVASPGFHLRHLTGVLDRLFTYASGESLSPAQFRYLGSESDPNAVEGRITGKDLVFRFGEQVGQAIIQLRGTPGETLAEPREVGRARLPSTVLGLFSHAAEHTQRHVGQLLVTSRILRSLS